MPQQCLSQRDDYMECLHHTKEIARVTRIKTEELKQAEKRISEEGKAKKEAVVAAQSNMPKLNIIEEKV